MGNEKKVDIMLGGAFNATKLHKQLLGLRHQMPNLTPQDVAAFEEIVERHARRVSGGSEFSRQQKLALKNDLMKIGSLSMTDKMALKRVIDSGM